MAGKIEWCDEQANPFHGCHHGCEFCYARRFALRHGGNIAAADYYALRCAGLHPFSPAFNSTKLFAMADRWKRARAPRRIFLGSMGDLGGAWDYHGIAPDGSVQPDEYERRTVQQIVASVIKQLPQHTFLLLTKNPCGLADITWPNNVHVGVSVSCSGDAVQRVDRLSLRVQAGLRWVSVEPLLDHDFDPGCLDHDGIGWVVVGAQTGPGAGEAPVLAALEIVGWCLGHGVPCFVKNNMIRLRPDHTWPQQIPTGGQMRGERP